MAVFDPKQVVVLLDGKEISDWADGSDVISAVNQVDAGQLVIGANGTGVFIANPDNSGKLTLKIKQICKRQQHPRPATLPTCFKAF